MTRHQYLLGRKLLFCLGLVIVGIFLKAQDIQALRLSVDHIEHTDLHVVDGYSVVGHNGNDGQRPFIANKQPALGWVLKSLKQGTFQSAYRIIVADHPDSVVSGIGNIWDSGKALSRESTNVPYLGKPLSPGSVYAWRVMVWDGDDNPSPWSPVCRFWTADSLTDYKTAYYPLLKTDEIPQDLLHAGDVIRIDFGRAAFGQLRFTLDTNDTDAFVTVRMGEAVHPDGRINNKPGGTIRYAEYNVPLRQGRHTYKLQLRPDGRNTGAQAIKMPDYIGEVIPFRYVEIEGYKGNVETVDIVRSIVHYPFDDFAAHFESSDSILNAVWQLCKYSIMATSFTGIYVDGDRERIPYEADAYINQLCHYNVDREYTMARRSHEYLLHHATWPTEWILQSVLMAYNDYLYTGDIRSVHYNYDDLKAKILIPLREDNGLISTRTGKQTRQLMESIHYSGNSLRDIVDWPHTGGFGMAGNGETDGFVFTDFNAVVNAFHYKALCSMAILAEVMGRTDDAKLFSDKAAVTRDAFRSLLWDKNKYVYRDGVDTEHASLHTNMIALAFGLVPEDRIDKVTDFIRSRGMSCSVYGSQFLMDAVYAAGDADYGLALLTSQSDRSWYNMIRAGSTITMEAWDNKYKPNQDWNHAWGAVPANIIPRRLMGIEPAEPGWNSFVVKPQIGSLQWARINVPTIKGQVRLSCEQSTSSYTMNLVVPANTVAHVELPVKTSGKPQVLVNGMVVKFSSKDGKIRLLPMPGGNYEIVLNY